LPRACPIAAVPVLHRIAMSMLHALNVRILPRFRLGQFLEGLLYRCAFLV